MSSLSDVNREDVAGLLEGLVGKRIRLAESIAPIDPNAGRLPTYSQFTMIVDSVLSAEDGAGYSLVGKDASEYMLNASAIVSVEVDEGNSITVGEHYEERTERRTTIELPGIDLRHQVTRSFRDTDFF